MVFTRSVACVNYHSNNRFAVKQQIFQGDLSSHLSSHTPKKIVIYCMHKIWVNVKSKLLQWFWEEDVNILFFYK